MKPLLTVTLLTTVLLAVIAAGCGTSATGESTVWLDGESRDNITFGIGSTDQTVTSQAGSRDLESLATVADTLQETWGAWITGRSLQVTTTATGEESARLVLYVRNPGGDIPQSDAIRTDAESAIVGAGFGYDQLVIEETPYTISDVVDLGRELAAKFDALTATEIDVHLSLNLMGEIEGAASSRPHELERVLGGTPYQDVPITYTSPPPRPDVDRPETGHLEALWDAYWRADRGVMRAFTALIVISTLGTIWSARRWMRHRRPITVAACVTLAIVTCLAAVSLYQYLTFSFVYG